MKKPILIVALLLSGFLFEKAAAQVHVGVSFNIGVQPVWGPVGYDHVEYYYMPDIDAYYYVPNQQYVYQDRGRWIFSASLPSRYRNYNLYSGYKVVINEPQPYRNNDVYRKRYASYRNNHSQQVIRDSHEQRYFENKHHPEHYKWQQDNGHHNNGNGHKQGKDHNDHN